MFKNVQDFMI